LHFWPGVIRRRVMEELPFMATEIILMEGVKAGGSRQELHEAVRQHSLAAAKRVKEEGAENDLMSRIAEDERFRAVHSRLPSLTDPAKFTGRAAEQVGEFLDEEVEPLFATHADLLGKVDGWLAVISV